MVPCTKASTNERRLVFVGCQPETPNCCQSVHWKKVTIRCDDCFFFENDTVDGRNPAPARAYVTIRYDLYPRTPFSMLCSEALCAGAGFQSFNFFVLGTIF